MAEPPLRSACSTRTNNSSSSTATLKDGDPINCAWQNAQRYALKHFSPEQLAIVASAKSAEDVLAQMSLLGKQARGRSFFRGIKKIQPFLDRITQYSEILQGYSNSHMVIALLWGSINLILSLSYRFLNSIDRFVEILTDLGDHLPRMQQYGMVFAESDRVRDMLAAVYHDIMEFCMLVTNMFGRTGFRLLRKILWSDFEAQSTRVIIKLNKHRDLVDLEANAQNVVESKQARAYEYSHRELLECLEIVKWLGPADTESNLERLLYFREAGTGVWLLSNEQMVSWVSKTQKLLWVRGIPGCGKSVLCAGLIQHFRDSSLHDQTAFFLCDAGDATRRNSTAILRSLIAQLVAGNASLVQMARETVIKSGQERANSRSQLWNLFKRIIRSRSTSTFIMIDAWDECEDSQHSILMKELSELAVSTDLHIAVFSRQEPWLRRDLHNWETLEIGSNHLQHDMTLYIERALQRSPLSRIQDQSLRSKIVDVLISKSDGQFLWTRLMVEALEKATYVHDIRKLLDNVPRGLGRLYSSIFEKLLHEDKARQEAAHRLLKWLACSERHLTLNELGVALAVREGAPSIELEDRVLDLTGFLEDVCGSLVTISESQTDRGESVVSFVHLTLKEFLISSDELWGSNRAPISRFAVDKVQANQHLASICITYLSFDCFKDKNDRSGHDLNQSQPTFEFLEYAAVNWVRHLVSSGEPTMDLLRRLHLFLMSDQLLAYLERTVSLNNGAFSVSNLLVSQNLLNEWIGQCSNGDPRLTLVIDCFRSRLEGAVKDRTEQLGVDHTDSLAAKFQLAQLLHYRGQWTQAAVLHREVLDIRLLNAGERDLNSLESMYELACVLTRLGKHEESRPLHETCLEQRRAVLGAKHVSTLLSEDALAKTLKEEGLLDEAETLARSTLVAKRRIFGEDALETVKTMDNLAAILKDVGLRWSKSGNEQIAKQAFWECEMLSRKCLSIREASLGADNPQTLTAANMLGIVLQHLQRPEESEIFHRRVFQTRLKIFGPDNPHTQRSMRNLSRVLRDQGKEGEAVQIDKRYRESLDVDSTLRDREGGIMLP